MADMGEGGAGEAPTAWMAAEGTPLIARPIARPARYLVLLTADNTLTIKKTNRDTVESTQVRHGEMSEEALLRLGYTRATRGGHAQPMTWSPRADGSLWTTAVRAERKP